MSIIPTDSYVTEYRKSCLAMARALARLQRARQAIIRIEEAIEAETPDDLADIAEEDLWPWHFRDNFIAARIAIQYAESIIETNVPFGILESDLKLSRVQIA